MGFVKYYGFRDGYYERMKWVVCFLFVVDKQKFIKIWG